MKNAITLLMVLFSFYLASAQTVLYQDFTETTWPPHGWSIINQPGNWSRVQSNNAGGVAPEARLSWTPQFNAITRLVSPAVDLAGNTKVLVSFRHNVDHYTATYQIGLATRSGGASGTWNNVWVQNVSGAIPAQQVLVVVDNNDVNQPDFQIGFFFSGSSYNINYWYIDDIEVMLVADLDAALSTLNVPDFFAGEQAVNGSVLNLGIAAINSMNINWQLNSGAVNATSFSGLNITTGGSYNFTSNQPINVDPGTYELKVWVSDVNGMTGDDVPENDTITKTISVVSQANLRKPLFEEFTSSTCPPCATFNNSVMNPFYNQYSETFTLIKYQMNWPGVGDPYYTAEGGVRRNYYGLNAVPWMFIEGVNVPTSWAGVSNAYNAALSSPAFMEINSQHVIEGDVITVNTNILSQVAVSDAAVHIVVIENTTYGNVGSNGETSFKHVMMKMLPNANGTIVNLEAGETLNLQYSHDMSTTFVEEMDDLSVVVFVQNNTNKSIYQSAYSVEVTSFGTPGDSNCDGQVDVLDVVATINHVLGNNPQPFCFENADINGDGVITVIDVVGTINIIIGGTKHANIPVKSEPAYLYLGYDRIVIQTDGTIAGLQFEIIGTKAENLIFMLRDHEVRLSEADNKVTAIIFNLNNTPIPAGRVELFRIENGIERMTWGEVIAANVNANEVKVNIDRDAKINFSEQFQLNIFPNPSTGEFSVDVTIPEASDVKISIIDLMGKETALVYQGILSAGDHRLYAKTGLPAGMHFLHLTTGTSVSQSLFIQKTIRIMISD